MVNVRGRSIGLSRNQRVPSVLSKVKGRPVDTSSPLAASPAVKSTLYTHRARPSEAEEEATQRWSPDEDSRRSSPVPSTTPKPYAKDWKQGGRGLKCPSSDSSHDAEQLRNAAVFNPPPAASESEDDSEDNQKLSQAARPGVDGLLLNDSDSDDQLARRGDLRPTAFTSLTTEKGATSSGKNSAAPIKPSQVSSLSQPISSGGSHFENDVGHVRKPKAKQTYSKPKPHPKAVSKKSRKTFEEHVAPESPEKRKILFQAPDDSDESSSSKPVKSTVGFQLDLDSDSKSETKTPAKPVRKRKGRASSDNKPREEKKSKPIFWVPDDSPDREIDKEQPAKEVSKAVRRLSSSSLSDLSFSDEELQTITKNEKDSTCPWCGKHIKPEALKAFAKGRRLNVQMQTKFCRSHQKQTAKDDWSERGYPRIDWASLPDRFRKHHDVLLNIVNGQSSFFRDALAADIRQGKSRTLRKEENLTPGYYGPHGFNIMSDFLVTQFSDLLKERAVSDRVIAGRGSAAFIQSVLVAELAVRLIKEDMGVDDGEARAVLNESKELGEIVHEEA